MPRLFHQPPKYRLHKSTNQAVVSFFGKVIQIGPYGSERSHQRYQEIIGEWQQRRHQAENQPQKKADELLVEAITTDTLRQKWKQGLQISLYELIVVYQRYANQYYRKHGKITREANLIKEVLTPLGEKHGRDKVTQFGPVDLDNFRDDLISDFDWSRKHINKQIVRVIAMFKWAAKKELCSAEIHVQLKALGGLKKGRTSARETKGVSCVEDSIVEKTIAGLLDVVADMVRLQRLTGARPGEICSLRPADLDRSGEVWLYQPNQHKTEHHEKHRIITIGPQAQEVLRPYLLRPADNYCFSPAESEIKRHQRRSEERTTPVRKRDAGRIRGIGKRKIANCYSADTYRHAVQRVCKRLKIEKWSPNQLRHTAATEIRKQFGLEAAQVVCGHQTADVTQVYAERDLKLAIEVAKAVG